MEHKFHWEVLRKMGLPFQKFCLFRIISSGTSQKVVFHLHPKRDFRYFLVNGKRSMKHLIYQVLVLYRTVRYKSHYTCTFIFCTEMYVLLGTKSVRGFYWHHTRSCITLWDNNHICLPIITI